MWRAERIRVLLRHARGGQLRESTPAATQVDEDGVAEDALLLSADKVQPICKTYRSTEGQKDQLPVARERDLVRMADI